MELEDKLGNSKEQNNVLRSKLEGLLGNSPDRSYPRGSSSGKTEKVYGVSHGRMNTRRLRTEDGLPIVISYRASHTALTSLLPKVPGNNIGVLLRSQKGISKNPFF